MVLDGAKTSYYDIQEAMKALKDRTQQASANKQMGQTHERQEHRSVVRDGDENPSEVDGRKSS